MQHVRDRGQSAVVVLVVVVALGAALAAALVDMGTGAHQRVRAQTAADAAALASLDAGRAAAARLAAQHGAVLVAWEQRGPDVVVTVRVGRASATARASDEP